MMTEDDLSIAIATFMNRWSSENPTAAVERFLATGGAIECAKHVMSELSKATKQVGSYTGADGKQHPIITLSTLNQPNKIGASMPRQTADDLCATCRHFQQLNSLQGECRRFPPVGGETNFNPKGEPRVPIVPADFWCGEFTDNAVSLVRKAAEVDRRMGY